MWIEDALKQWCTVDNIAAPTEAFIFSSISPCPSPVLMWNVVAPDCLSHCSQLVGGAFKMWVLVKKN